jgi:hypothetical protein
LTQYLARSMGLPQNGCPRIADTWCPRNWGTSDLRLHSKVLVRWHIDLTNGRDFPIPRDIRRLTGFAGFADFTFPVATGGGLAVPLGHVEPGGRKRIGVVCAFEPTPAPVCPHGRGPRRSSCPTLDVVRDRHSARRSLSKFMGDCLRLKLDDRWSSSKRERRP